MVPVIKIVISVIGNCIEGGMVFLTGVAEKCNGYAGNVSDISGKSCNIFIRRLIGLCIRIDNCDGIVSRSKKPLRISICKWIRTLAERIIELNRYNSRARFLGGRINPQAVCAIETSPLSGANINIRMTVFCIDFKNVWITGSRRCSAIRHCIIRVVAVIHRRHRFKFSNACSNR